MEPVVPTVPLLAPEGRRGRPPLSFETMLRIQFMHGGALVQIFLAMQLEVVLFPLRGGLATTKRTYRDVGLWPRLTVRRHARKLPLGVASWPHSASERHRQGGEGSVPKRILCKTLNSMADHHVNHR